MSFGRRLMGPIGWRCPKLPDSIDDSRLNDEPGKWNAQPTGLPSLVESFIQTAKLYDILDEILDREELHDPVTPATDIAVTSRATPNTRTLLELDSMIMGWRAQLPPYLRYDPNSTASTETDAVTVDGFPIPSSDLLVQAKRLYLRYCKPVVCHAIMLTMLGFCMSGCSFCAQLSITSSRGNKAASRARRGKR